MPTTPMASAIGMRTNASTIITSRPTSVSIMAASGGCLVAAGAARHEHLVDVHQPGEADHRIHEVYERAHRNAQHVSGVAVAVDLAGLDPDLPGQEEHDRG